MSRPFTFMENLMASRRRSWVADESASRGTEAAEKASLLDVDRADRFRRIAESLSGSAHNELLSNISRVQENLEREGDVCQKSVDMVLHDGVLPALDKSRCVRRPDQLIIRATDEDCVAACCNPYDDGSGLILVSEGLVGLVGLFSNQFALAADPGINALNHISDARLRNAAGRRSRVALHEWAVDVALMRWRFLHQRLYGNSASLHRRLTPEQQRVADLVNLNAVLFVVAHECSHHILGHSERVMGFTTAADIQPCIDDVALECAADEKALDILSERGRLDAVIAVSALLAICAVAAFETTTIVRSVATHPAPDQRAARVLARVAPADQPVVRELVGRVADVSRRASDFTEFVEASYWKTLLGCGEVLTQPHPERRFQEMFETDRILSAPLERYPVLLDHLAHEGLDVRPAADDIRHGDTAEGLSRLSIPERTIGKTLAPERGLSFAPLHRIVKSGIESMGSTDPTNRHVATLLCTRLVESTISKESNER